MGRLKEWKIELESDKMSEVAKNMIEKHHYSGTARSQHPKATYRLIDPNGKVKGVAVFGTPCSANVEQFYGTPGKVLELRRLVMVPPKPKNAGSFFLSGALRHLKNNTDYEVVVSYADPNYGHTGGIYRASNFVLMGEEMGNANKIVLYKGRKYTIRQVYQKNKNTGSYHKKSMELQKAIKSGEAKLVPQKRKIIYAYPLKEQR